MKLQRRYRQEHNGTPSLQAAAIRQAQAVCENMSNLFAPAFCMWYFTTTNYSI
jgi:hypothetical protein